LALFRSRVEGLRETDPDLRLFTAQLLDLGRLELIPGSIDRRLRAAT
jgi:hypothetical protein